MFEPIPSAARDNARIVRDVKTDGWVSPGPKRREGEVVIHAPVREDHSVAFGDIVLGEREHFV